MSFSSQMEYSAAEKHRLRLLVYLGGFFLSLSVALGAYINSSFIEQFVGEQRVGLIYAAAAIVSLLLSSQVLRLVRRFGNQRTIVFLALTNFLALLGTIIWSRETFAVWLVGAYIVLSFLTAINLDVYLEELSDDRTTGRIRGLFLTASNLAWLASPWLASNTAARLGFGPVYFFAALTLLPFLYIATRHLKDVMARRSEHLSLRSGLARVLATEGHNLRRILTIDFLLNFFYAIMVIYMPIYLREHIGLGWPEIGLIFTIMLVPFVVLDIPLGRLADLWLGEKELISIGLIIAALGCFLIAPIATASASVIAWAFILLLTRVGAATVEVMKETYLFKQIDGRDANIVFISRNMSPLAYVLAPVIASAFLLFAPLGSLFILLGFILLLGLPVALNLKDTK